MNEFIARLKQRKLVQWAIAYVAGAWAVLQVLDLVAQEFGWPGVVMRIITVLLGIGFFVALVLAWYHGERGAQRVGGIELAMLAALLVIAAVAVGWVRHGHRPAVPAVAVVSPAASTATAVIGADTVRGRASASAASSMAAATIPAQAIPAKSIAVLPFENLSNDKDNEYFVAGMQDLILTKLADIGDLKVISRTSTEKYKSHPDDLKTIGQQLGVATILEGSVQKAANQVLINVQLIDVNTDGHIWAESYTRTLDNIFGVEGEVAEKIATALNARLTPAETARVADVPTTNTAAYNAFLKGEYYGGRGVSNLSKADFLTAFDYYHKAVSEDPEFALAWASLASSQLLYFHFIGNDQPGLVGSAKAAIDRAFALQPQLEQAYLAKGIYQYYVEQDFAQAAKAFATAHKLKPQDATPLFASGIALNALGDPDAAIEALQRVSALDPRQLGPWLVMSTTYSRERRYADAERGLKHVLAIDPSSMFGVDNLAAVYGLTGDLDAMQSLLDGSPDSVKGNPVFKRDLAQYFIYRRDWAAARTTLLDAQATARQSDWMTECMLGDVERYAGDPAKARPYYQRCTDLLPKAIQQSTNGDAESGDLGVALVHLGRIKEALEHGQRGMEAYAPTNYRGQYALQSMAQIQAQAGMAQDAVATLDRLLSMPGAGEITSAPLLKINPIWDPIRKDPRFQALLKKYSQSGPASANGAGMASTAGTGSGDD